MKPNPMAERARKLDQARDAFVRAAALLDPLVRWERMAVAAALVEGALAMLRIAQSDPDERELDAAHEFIRERTLATKEGGK